MKLYVVPSEDIQFNDIFYLSSIDFDFYDARHDNIIMPPTEKCFLFLSLTDNLFYIDDNKFKQWVNDFFKKNSFLILNNRGDSFRCIDSIPDSKLQILNNYYKNILIYYTGFIEADAHKRFLNLNLVQRQYSEWIKSVEYYYNSSLLSICRTNNYLLTTLLRKNRPHREILANELKSRGLLDNLVGSIRHNSHTEDVYNNWSGDTSFPSHDVHGLKISWDLYNRASFEIVPETLYQKCTFVTEKTIKPIVARMPFLVLSNNSFYKNLKEMGFKTFDSLIDESFAIQENIYDRTCGLVNTTQDILNNGSLEFYNAAQEICDFNFDHYLYISKKDEYRSYVNLLNYEKYIIDAQDK